MKTVCNVIWQPSMDWNAHEWTMTTSLLCQWGARCYKDGGEPVESEPCNKQSTWEYWICKDCNHQRLTVWELESDLEIPKTTVCEILTQDFVMNCVVAKFVLQFLLPGQMEHHAAVAHHYLWTSFSLKDESWVYCYDPKMKARSMFHWISLGSPTQKEISDQRWDSGKYLEAADGNSNKGCSTVEEMLGDVCEVPRCLLWMSYIQCFLNILQCYSYYMAGYFPDRPHIFLYATFNSRYCLKGALIRCLMSKPEQTVSKVNPSSFGWLWILRVIRKSLQCTVKRKCQNESNMFSVCSYVKVYSIQGNIKHFWLSANI